MDIRIEGNPGTGNKFNETHIEHADHFYNQVEKVENNYTTTIEIHFNATINLNGEILSRFCTKLTQRLPIAFHKFIQRHFDGEGDVSLTIPLQVVANSMRHYHHIIVEPEEVDGTDFFPSIHSDEAANAATCALRYNPKVPTVLALYNLSMQRSVSTGDAIVHYVLFHAFLEVDGYDGASRHLAAFRRHLADVASPLLSSEEQEEADAQVLLQLYFILFHESFHIILRQDPKTYETAIDTTRKLLLDIAAKSAQKMKIPSSASEDTFIGQRRYLQEPTKVPS